jgi:hypothetical protein
MRFIGIEPLSGYDKIAALSGPSCEFWGWLRHHIFQPGCIGLVISGLLSPATPVLHKRCVLQTPPRSSLESVLLQ